MPKTARRWFISGIVQGIGFRFFAQKKASSLGVAGWARNLDDGRVEVYAVGPPDRLDELAAALHIGPYSAEVRAIEEHEAPVESVTSFTIR
jgi:acylphosphatase